MAHAMPSCAQCTGLVPLVPDERGGLVCPRCAAAQSASEPHDTLQGPVPPPPRPNSKPAPANPFSAAFLASYQLVSFLGKGAFGAVYLMNQQSLDRLVAVKVLLNHGFEGDGGQRLVKEGRVLARLSHPGILAIHDVGMDGALGYMVCEYVDGEPLAERMRRAPALSVPEALRVLIEMLDALAEAHRHGVVHRDLKPENVLLSRDGAPKICDFGLARVQDLASATTVGFIQGTPAYMAPEQCRGDHVGPAADIYAMGVIAFALLAGQLPFRGTSVPSFLYQHVNEAPPRLRTLVPALPPALEAVVDRALAKQARDRFADAAEFGAALRAVAAGRAARVAAPVRTVEPRVAGRELARRYVLVRRLSQDESHESWLAVDSAAGGTEVLVTLHAAELWADPVRSAALATEAHMAMSLDHPGIARLIAVEQGAEPFLVTEYVPGLRLAEVIARRRATGGRAWAPEEALPWIDALASALDHAHDSGVLHRDVHPGSIVLAAPGLAPVLMDTAFGAEVSRWRQKPGAPAPPSHPPEQSQGMALDPRADVFGLAAVVHELLTLAPPAGPAGDEASPGLAAVAGVPWEVATVLAQALSADRARRPVRAGQFAGRFRDAVAVVKARLAAERVPRASSGDRLPRAPSGERLPRAPSGERLPRALSGERLPRVSSQDSMTKANEQTPRSRTPPRSRPDAPPRAPGVDHDGVTQALWHWAFALALVAYLAISSLELPKGQVGVAPRSGQDGAAGGSRQQGQGPGRGRD